MSLSYTVRQLLSNCCLTLSKLLGNSSPASPVFRSAHIMRTYTYTHARARTRTRENQPKPLPKTQTKPVRFWKCPQTRQNAPASASRNGKDKPYPSASALPYTPSRFILKGVPNPLPLPLPNPSNRRHIPDSPQHPIRNHLKTCVRLHTVRDLKHPICKNTHQPCTNAKPRKRKNLEKLLHLKNSS